MNNPLISIIVPVYNSEKYIKECLDSIVDQTYSNLEIIIINDGSIDKSLEIIKSYKDKRIILISKENGGVSSARNEGLKQATGDYVIFVDSDDYFTNNNAIESVVRDATGCDIVKYGYVTSTNNKKIEDGLIKILKKSYESGESFLLDTLNKKKDYGWYVWQYMYKRSLWKGIAFQNIEIFEDLSINYKVILKAKKVHINNVCIYTYRENNESITKNVTFNKCIQLLNTTKEVINNVNSLNISKELKTLLNNNFACGYVTELMVVDYINKEEKNRINKLLIENKEISNYIKYGKQKTIIKLVNLFGIDFVELLLSIRNKIK